MTIFTSEDLDQKDQAIENIKMTHLTLGACRLCVTGYG